MAKKQPKKSPVDPGLIITKAAKEALSPAQTEFNRLMKRLENARAKHLREQTKLDGLLLATSRDLMPLVENVHRTDLQILNDVVEALDTVKLSAKRRELLEDLVCAKAGNLLDDPAGLNDKDIAGLGEILEKFDTEEEDDEEFGLSDEEEAEEFDHLRAMLESAAAQAGVKLDLSDLDPSMDPADFERIFKERLQEAAENQEKADAAKPARKQTKAQINKAKRIKEQEDAKKRDLKSLYKQLAKALHPDLESDPTLKSHKEDWMKRLTTAYANGDLRGLLQIEMEWLGEEATNLSTAGDEKLKVYCAVLKEQIREQKEKTEWLEDEPQYFPLRRFSDPYTGKMASPTRILKELKESVRDHLGMLKKLRGTKTARRALLEAWADQHENSLSRMFF